MGISPVEQRRVWKLQLLESIALHSGKSISFVISKFSVKTGLKNSTVSLMLHELKDAELIKIEDGLVTYTENNNNGSVI